jgi:hypothetical protein
VSRHVGSRDFHLYWVSETGRCTQASHQHFASDLAQSPLILLIFFFFFFLLFSILDFPFSVYPVVGPRGTRSQQLLPFYFYFKLSISRFSVPPELLMQRLPSTRIKPNITIFLFPFLLFESNSKTWYTHPIFFFFFSPELF